MSQTKAITYLRRQSLVMMYMAVLLCAMWGHALADIEQLKCYQCRVEGNEECTDADLKPCPNDQAYDVCMVSVTKNATNFFIEKRCTLGPCNLRGPDSIGLDKCDRSQDAYSCFECCKENGCNGNLA